MKKSLKLILFAVVMFFIGVIVTLFVIDYFNLFKEDTIKTVKSINITEKETINSSVEKVYDSVVVIQTYNLRGKLSSTGTGFVYKKDNKKGYIITNYHVIKDSETVKVINNKEEEVTATVLGSDEYSDIAVLAIDEDYVLDVAQIGDSSKVNLGDTLFTVGSPLGIKYKGTVTKGILSGKDRQVTVDLTNGSFIMNVLQTDAAINPGNSGGPLLNINGEVIGVTSLKLVQDEIEGMGFALPIESVMNTISKLENGKEIERPIFGVQLLDASSNLLDRYDVDISDKIKSGAVIVKVENNTPASKAKLKVGDVITKINDDDILDVVHFRSYLYKYSVGEKIKITYIRGEKVHTVSVKLTDKLED